MTAGLGDRYVVDRWGSRWAVFDLADDNRHSTWPDEFDAILAAAKANRNNAERRVGSRAV